MFRSTLGLAVCAALACIGLVSPHGALASHPVPTQAKKFQFALVNNFYPCDSPNTLTQTGSFDACTPAGSLGFCTTSPGWSGKLTAGLTGSAKSGTQDIKFAASAKGLSCEGEALCISLTMRVTSDDCPEGSCTAIDIQDVKLDASATPFGGCCIVTGGACKIKTTLLTGFPAFFANGKSTSIAILGCGLETGLPGVPHPPDLTCGILLP
jgi:hypothetical protein